VRPLDVISSSGLPSLHQIRLDQAAKNNFLRNPDPAGTMCLYDFALFRRIAFLSFSCVLCFVLPDELQEGIRISTVLIFLI
jgi:hypothetical protein